ncbi:hypothetical protein LTS10_012047 [Elasticomyces elasticus]|nr:hypothetical protein LTS10_012047 [Elasticomyces elasticus]
MTTDPTTSGESQQPTVTQAMATIMPSQRAQINEVMSLITKLSIESKTAMLVKIFELSLQEDDMDEVNGRAQRLPGLLITCVHVRGEALNIYYSINRFRLCVQDYDINPIMPFCTSYREHFTPPKNFDRRSPQIGIQVLRTSGSPNIQNLMNWLHSEWVGEMPWSWLMDPTILDRNSVAVWNVLLTGIRMRSTGMTWGSAEYCLGPVLANLKGVDPRW